MQARDEEADSPSYSAPLFVRPSPTADYVYYGSYREPRFSDRLDHSRMADEVPLSVKEYWARVLTGRNKPYWVTSVFLDEGFIEKDVVAMEDGSTNEDLATELVEGIKAEDVMKAFETVRVELVVVLWFVC
jgi:hypothetical protein